MKTLFMFPGQGAQVQGMGKELAEEITEVKELYCKASEILGYDLASLCFDGPQDKLNLTEFAQPAIFVTSIAHLTALRIGKLSEELKDVIPDGYAGLSLGEYTALHVSGALNFDDALKLVQLRGKGMQQAADQSKGTMVSILGLDEETVNKLCDKVLSENISEESGDTIISGVNYNCPGQIVVSGSIKACQRAAELAAEFGAMKAIPLSVAGAFHTQMMSPAAEMLSSAIDNCQLKDPDMPVFSNVDTLAYSGSDEIKDKLLKQLVGPVKWQHTIENLLDDGFDRFVEIGPGKVLTGLVKKVSRNKKIKAEIVKL